ncbi:hypothetical protein [Mesorhizobium sp. BR1-1-14]|uniref:hypothetical protein n=1 Tax=Mesorhizobium sp. BR1-1-14 TaxID=2876655 RepID=UPI001CD1848C|nr:hypothetical protein [Mesorhizobium sp. BR1-1-14]MBZ9959321.1 hypothetical protein [Mesorhizobium sp. BR1-1-14]
MDSKELKLIIRNHNSQIRRRVAEGVSGAAGAFVALSTSGAGARMSFEQASKALAATHSALAELARRATSDRERVRYKRLMDTVLAELKAVVQRILDTQGAQYRPLTAALRAAASDLSSAYQRARQTISNINNAADLLTAFGSIVSALR